MANTLTPVLPPLGWMARAAQDEGVELRTCIVAHLDAWRYYLDKVSFYESGFLPEPPLCSLVQELPDTSRKWENIAVETDARHRKHEEDADQIFQ
mgnify:CR=1 FL=1